MFIACGLNHKTAPLDVREKIALPMEKQASMLNRLVELPLVSEAAILSTCNRTEIYCQAEDPDAIIPWIAKEQQISPSSIQPYFYLHSGHSGIRHTLRVASGLDSMMLGEPQILGQLKQAFQSACEAGTVRQNLRQVFEYVFSASKRIRNHSGIGNNPVSIAFAAVQLMSQLFPDFKPLNAFIIGSGEMSSLVAKYLHKHGVQQFMIASRSPEKAQALATSLTGTALTISDIPEHLAKADVVISATACPLPFITKTLVKQAMAERNNAPMFFLDLAVPRDIERDVAELDNVYLYNIDDLKLMADQGMKERRHAALHAEQLVNYELENYIRWHRSLKANEIICDYRTHMQSIARNELLRAKQKLEAGHSQMSVLSEFTERLVNKLTHNPTVGLRQAAEDNRQDLLELAEYLFKTTTDTTSNETIT
ncbi:glutamyl-tRNA reductase [Legionella impletisoli]|uniref:Glutamyl-tRNA reductase n=1 Tax=Legionella impletisoli TaxID=343510 RepID=A0A917ND39_9GAMM|nr:glutamyl-tRNA reductase [Legionella impletisoli]GGI86073.1 glutamyl-tRNA reductase [Legionella impletisoli]